MDQSGNPTMNDWLGLAREARAFGANARDAELDGLRKQQLENTIGLQDQEKDKNELSLAHLRMQNDITAGIKDAYIANQNDSARSARIKADTEQWAKERQDGMKQLSYARSLVDVGQYDQANTLLAHLYNKTVADGGTVEVSGKGKDALFNVTYADGSTGQVKADYPTLFSAADGWFAKDQGDYFEKRAKQKMDLEAFNMKAMHNPAVYQGPGGDLVAWVDGFNTSTGAPLGMGHSVGSGQTFHSMDELAQAGYKPLGTAKELLGMQEQQQVLDTRKPAVWAARLQNEQNGLAESLVGLRPQIEAETDPAKKAALTQDYNGKIESLKRVETLQGEVGRLSDRDMGQVANTINGMWGRMKDDEKLQYHDYSDYAGKMLPAVLAQYKALKEKGSLSAAMALDADKPAAPAAPAVPDPMQFLPKRQPAATRDLPHSDEDNIAAFPGL